MNNLKLASNYDAQSQDGEQQENKFDKQNKQLQIEQAHLTAAELGQIQRGERTIDDLAAEREEYKKEAEVKLRELLMERPERGSLIDMKEYKAKLAELEDTKSPDRTQKIIDDLEKLQDERANQKAEEERKRELDDPLLKAHTDKIFKELDQPLTVKWVGTRQKDPFKEWFRQEIAKDPTIKNAKELLAKLHEDRNGLKPRREFFEGKLSPTLKKYGVTLDKAPYFEAEGLSEREDAMKQIFEGEKQIEGLLQAGLYSVKAKKEIIKSMLEAPDAHTIHRIHKNLMDTTREEAEQYTNQTNSVLTNQTITVHGIEIQAMSQKSVNLFLADYQNYDLETRKDTILNWKKIAENEGKLIKDLGEVYKDDIEGFKVAVKVFELLSYQDKEKALKEQKKLVEQNDKDTVKESNEMLRDSLSEIESARNQKVLSNKTAKEFRDWASDSKNYTDEETDKLDLKKQKKLMDAMKDKQPIFESKSRNIAAYRWAKEKKFKPLIDKFKKDNPDTPEEELRDWQMQYDEGSFSERKQVYLDLKEEAAEMEKEREKNKERETKLGIKKEDKEASENSDQKRTMVVQSAREAIASKEEQEVTSALRAIYFYLAFTDAIIDKDSELKSLRDELEQVQRDISTGNVTEQTFEQELEAEMNQVTNSNTGIAEELEEAQIKHLNIMGAQQSEYRHGKEKDSRKRAEQESLDRTETDSLEEDLTVDAYAQLGDNYALDEDGTGEEIINVEFDNLGMAEQDLRTLKQRTYQQQSQIDYQEGFSNINLVDINDRKLNSAEAEAIQEAENEDLKARLAEETQDKMEDRNTTGGKVFDLQKRMAARRKAEEVAGSIIEDQEEEKLREAA